MYADWGAAARAEIAERMTELPADASLEDRRKALRKDATLFHGGTSWGKRVWTKECRKYLEQHGQAPRSFHQSKEPRVAAAMRRGDITFPFKEEGNGKGH